MESFLSSLSHLGLKRQLSVGFAISALFLLLVGAMSIYEARSLRQNFEFVAATDVPKVRETMRLKGYFKDVRAVGNMLGLPANSKSDQTLLRSLLEDTLKKLGETQTNLKSMPVPDKERELLDAATAALDTFKKTAERLHALAAFETDKQKEEFFALLQKEFKFQGFGALRTLNVLEEYQAERSKSKLDEVVQSTRRANQIVMASVAIGFLMAGLLGAMITRLLSQQILRVAGTLQGEAKEIEVVSEEIHSSTAILTEFVDAQSSNAQGAVSAAEQVSVTGKKNAENAARSKVEATSSEELVRSTRSTMERVLQAMEDIQLSVQEVMSHVKSSNEKLGGLITTITDISTKTQMINDIVFQTKLLSFNASVEAARAGQHGVGFAVVAGEIGNLARTSGNAATEIANLLRKSLGEVEDTVKETRTRAEQIVLRTKERVSIAAQYVHDCNGLLNQVSNSYSELSQAVSDIANSSQEQANGVEEINRAMISLEQGTRRLSELAKKNSGSTQTLVSNSDTLNQISRDLLITLNGNRAA